MLNIIALMSDQIHANNNKELTPAYAYFNEK